MASKARKTEHSGPKKGRGAFYGRKAEAKKASNQRRRAVDARLRGTSDDDAAMNTWEILATLKKSREAADGRDLQAEIRSPRGGPYQMTIETQTSERTAFPLLARELLRNVDEALPKLRAVSASQAAQALAPGKWSSKQVIGHLIDSAANNHQRFVRAQQGPALVFPAYAQDHWVRSQHYEDRSWDDLTILWHAYNHHLAHVIEHFPEDLRNVPCTVGTNAPVTLGFLAHDYVVHLRHHLGQVGALP